MIQEIIKGNKYLFSGTKEDLRKCIRNFRIVKVVLQGRVNDMEMFDAYATFRYHGETHKIYISKLWNDNKFNIEYRGKVH